jgi:hypothetical protein
MAQLEKIKQVVDELVAEGYLPHQVHAVIRGAVQEALEMKRREKYETGTGSALDKDKK